MACCAKCFHRDVCKTCDSCDGERGSAASGGAPRSESRSKCLPGAGIHMRIGRSDREKCSGRQMPRSAVDEGRCRAPQKECQHYIDRDALADEVNDLRTMLAELQQAAQPRKTGKWQEWRPPRNMVLCGVTKLHVCSECNAKFVQTFRYCPHCGTMMEQEGPTWKVY